MKIRFQAIAWFVTVYLIAAISLFGETVAQRSKSSPTPVASPSPAATPSPVPAQPGVTAPHIMKPRPEYPLPVGQTYVYNAMWRVFNAGTASLQMEQTGNQVHLTGKADASGAAALLYKVHDQYESKLDPATFCSHGTSRQIEEGFRRVDINIAFDYARRKSVLDQKNLKKKETKHEEHAIPACVADVLSAIYYVASLPLETGATYAFPVNDGGETINVSVHVEAREQVKTPAGTFQTIRVQPTAGGLLKDKGKILIWYSDDAARVPVQARAHMYWGTLTFTLQRIDRK